jgi:CDP-diacylglycerol--serine O-phosphatidyltransferase
MDFLAVWGGFLPLLAGSIRLARFNIQLTGLDKTYFVGLPIPTAAITLSSFTLFSLHFYSQPLRYPAVMMILILTVSILMVSTIRYELMPNLFNNDLFRQKLQLPVGLVLLTAIVLFPRQLLFPLMIVYVLSGLIRWIVHLINSSNKGESLVESKS